jgi:hypothetical protein
VSNENFRRELGHVFEEMTGSPSAALPDKVRSSLAKVPEQRAPFWIAGVAATVIAAMVVGIVVVGNFNRPQTNVLPAGVPTPSVSTVPKTLESNLPAFVCAASRLGMTPAPPVAFINGVRTGTHTGYDRLTIEFKNGQPGTTGLRTQSGTTFTNSPRGDQVTLAGQNGILVVINGADLHTSYSGSTDIKTGYATLVEVRQVEDFEGVVQLALGVSGAACYRAFTLINPDRLVIDIQAG